MTPSIHVRTPDGEYDFPITAQDTAAHTPLSTLLAQHNHPLNTRCGGRGLCNACEITLTSGSVRSLDTGATIAGPAQIKSCRHIPETTTGEPVVLDIPSRALLRHEPSVVSNFKLNIPRALNPLAPPAKFPDDPWLGAAIDVGTTTVALILCDLRTGDILATESDFNGQIHYGEDVLTRINLCAGQPENLKKLQQAVVTTIQRLLEKACSRAHMNVGCVRSLVVAGNTVMQHLLAGADPTPIGVYPFSAVFLDHRLHPAKELGFHFSGCDSCDVHLLPSPAAYVGADLSAGVLATGMLYNDETSLLVDVGTNGEIILKHNGVMTCCATAAGPAFEGAGLSSGMRAVKGVIEKISFSRDPWQAHIGIIGQNNGQQTAPIGICGSAYIDFLAQGRRAELLTDHGRYEKPVPAGAESAVVQQGNGAQAFTLSLIAPRGRSGPIIISEHDIARLLQAKAAIAAGITTLLGLAKVAPSEITTLYLAGGFGMHIDLPNAIACGLLPGFVPEQIEVVGNTALGGALAVLQDKELLPEISDVCKKIESIELNLQPGFEDCYIDQLSLP